MRGLVCALGAGLAIISASEESLDDGKGGHLRGLVHALAMAMAYVSMEASSLSLPWLPAGTAAAAVPGGLDWLLSDITCV